MIFTYGTSLTGSSHIKRNIPCQDFHVIKHMNDGRVIAVVADGVGSASHAEAGARIAAQTAATTCEQGLIHLHDPITSLKSSYHSAWDAVIKTATENGHWIDEYDTTLTMAIYDGKTVYFGHSGDGGIIGLGMDGLYKAITRPQKVENYYVIPLRMGKEAWEFGVAEGDFVSVLLATDGVYDIFFPYLLKGTGAGIHIPMAAYFMETSVSRVNFLSSPGAEPITDDKTLVVLINQAVKPQKQPPSYYAEPDWETLKYDYNKKFYPHLYSDVERDADDR